jgi:glycine cleavage system transcriptional repressor
MRDTRDISKMNEISSTNTHHLVLAALGEDNTGIIEEFSRCILHSGCTINDSRMAVFGGDLALLLQVAGNWNNIAKLENQLPGIQARLGLTITSHRPVERESSKDLLPYAVDVVALDQPGIVHNLARFFAQRQINIQEMATMGYPAAHSGTPMFSVHMIIEIRAGVQIAALREDFMEFCDQLNLDAVMEPVKGYQ